MEIKDLLREPELLSEIVSALRASGTKERAQVGRECAGSVASPAAALIAALKPFLKPSRREKAEVLIKALSAAEICKSLKNSRG